MGAVDVVVDVVVVTGAIVVVVVTRIGPGVAEKVLDGSGRGRIHGEGRLCTSEVLCAKDRDTLVRGAVRTCSLTTMLQSNLRNQFKV